MKLDSQGSLNQQEIDYLKLNQLDEDKFFKLLDFFRLKNKYKVTDYPSVSPDDNLYKILKKLDDQIKLTNKDIKFIKHHNLTVVLENHELQEKKREEEFIQLQEKYQAVSNTEISLNSRLYTILKNINAGQTLTNKDYKLF